MIATTDDKRFLFAAATALAIAMGIGRFAYTPLLPLMLDGAHLSRVLAGVVAAANLAGYLVGAVLASRPALRAHRVAFIRVGLAISIATTGLVAIPSEIVWLAARAISGIASGFVLIYTASLVLDRGALRGRPVWAAYVFGGVGAGIAASAVAVPVFARLGGWQAGWLGLCALSAALAAITLPWIADAPTRADDVAPCANPPRAAAALFPWLLAAYGGEGLGYIIPATFMVAMISAAPDVARYAGYGWAIVGLVGIPANVLWNVAGVRFGYARSLVVAFAAQAAGVAAPAILHNAVGVIIGAVALGATFMGITVLATALLRELYPLRSHVALGRATAVFGVGQIAGPLIATAVSVHWGGYGSALLVAAAILALSAIVLAVGISRFSRPLSPADPTPSDRILHASEHTTGTTSP